MFDYRRTHHCGALSKKEIGEQVTLSGWVHRRRDHGGLIFIDLRDRYGITQLVFDPALDAESHATANRLRSEWVISAKGKVVPRGEGLTNPRLPTGEIEIRVEEMKVLSQAKTPPFSIADEAIEVNEDLRLTYRYLDMRRGKLHKSLLLRHSTMMAIRDYMDGEGFCEVTTPILAKSTPEGARDYLVPSRVHPGSFYALPQSPQLFKQLLMLGGMDRYFQIAPCFRDEDLRADRQPEFTQIDVEMSFLTPNELFSIIEGLLQAVFKETIGQEISLPFPRMPHAEALERYGTDKPDLRFGMELISLSDIAERSEFTVFLDQIRAGGIVKGLCVKGGADISRREIDEYTAFVGRFGIQGLAWMKVQEEGLSSNIVKFFGPEQQAALIARMEAKPGDLIFMVASSVDRANQGLDHLRRKIARDRNLIAPGTYAFLWVVDFPLMRWDPQERRLDTEHHPFTSPHPEDIHLMESDPLKVRSSSYDIVLNGYELGSGSQRIHDGELQRKIFEILKLTPEQINERFGFFVDALQHGTPPHLGIALGFDRLVMILSGTDNIRDVVAFPKTQRASDLMMDAPSTVDPTQLRDLRITIDPEK